MIFASQDAGLNLAVEKILMRLRTSFAFAAYVCFSVAAPGEPVAVRHAQGATRGFLALRSDTGKLLASGEVSQYAQGDQVTSTLTFRFLDGSRDEETTTYSQRGTFKLIRDHHVQTGPFFDKATDVMIDVPAGMVTIKTAERKSKDGAAAPKVETQRMEFPEDLANGLTQTLLLNVARDVTPFKVGFVAPTGKVRLVKLAISPDGTNTMRVVGTTRKVSVFRVHVEIGGVAGVIAPVVGKEPKDVFVWVLEGPVPAFVRLIGQLSAGGPVVSIEQAGDVVAAVGKPGKE